MDTSTTLHPGRASDDDDWQPEVRLDHDGARGELHLIVGEEAAGMAEGVDARTYDEIKERLDGLQRLEQVLAEIKRAGGGAVTIRYEGGKAPDWSLMSVFGREAEDSPMAGGSHIGAGDTLAEMLASAQPGLQGRHSLGAWTT